MSLRYGILCLLLCFVVLLLVSKNYELWTQPVEGIFEEGMKKAETRIEGPTVMGGPKERTSIASYIVISEKNIFNPERKEFSITPVDQPKPMTRPQIILYGVAISQDLQAASIVNPGRPLKKGEREMLTLKLGDQIGEYKLVKILPDRITLEAGEDSFEVLLFDPSRPKRRAFVRTEVKPAEIKSSSPTPAPPPAPVPTPKTVETPKPGEPSRQRVLEAPLPRPITPPPPSYPSTWRGRRPTTPYTPPASEGK